jgi:hypothetical protein
LAECSAKTPGQVEDLNADQQAPQHAERRSLLPQAGARFHLVTEPS